MWWLQVPPFSELFTSPLLSLLECQAQKLRAPRNYPQICWELWKIPYCKRPTHQTWAVLHGGGWDSGWDFTWQSLTLLCGRDRDYLLKFHYLLLPVMYKVGEWPQTRFELVCIFQVFKKKKKKALFSGQAPSTERLPRKRRSEFYGSRWPDTDSF